MSIRRPSASLVAGAGAAALLPVLVPPGVVLLGLAHGALSGLTALGIVLVWRAHRFVNVAGPALGALAGAVGAGLVARGGLWPWAAALAALCAGSAAGAACGSILGVRMRSSPRAVVFVGSLGLAYVVGGAASAILASVGSTTPLVPSGPSIEVFPVRLGLPHLAAVVVAAAGTLGAAAFLSRTRSGLSVRANASNEPRLRALGIDATPAIGAMWTLVGLLAAAGGILGVSLHGPQLDAGPSPGLLLLALAPAVVAGLRSPAGTMAASLALGAAYQSALWLAPRAALADAALLAVVAAAILIRLPRTVREQAAERASSWLAFVPSRPLPRNLAQRGIVRAARAAAPAAASAVAVSICFRLPASGAQRWAAVGAFAVAATAAGVVAGLTGRLSLGHWALTAVGAVAAQNLAGRVDLATGMLLAAAAAAAVAVLAGLASARSGPVGYAAVTLALATATWAVLATTGILDRGSPLPTSWIAGLWLDTPQRVAAATWAWTGVVLALVAAIRGSRFGLRALAVRDHEHAAAAHGVAAVPVRAAVDAVSGAIAGTAGYLYLAGQQIAHPSAFDPERSLFLLAIVAIGGLGSAWGPAAGAVVVQSAALLLPGSWKLLGTGAALLVVVLLRPAGLAAGVNAVRMRLLPPSPAAVAERVP